VVDTLGNLLEVVVHAANMHDTTSAYLVLSKVADKYSTIVAFSGDGGYRKTALEFVEKVLKLKMNISEKIEDRFAVIPIRWIVERTFAWLGNYRRLSKDYERLISSSENMIRIAMLIKTLKNCS
jgi:putative transposase